MRVNLRKLVEKGAPGLHSIQEQHLSELSVGEIFNCTLSWNWEEVPAFLGGFYSFRKTLKGILKE